MALPPSSTKRGPRCLCSLHQQYYTNGPGSAVLVPAPLSFGSFHSALLYFNIHMNDDMAILSLVTYLKKQPESHEPCLFVSPCVCTFIQLIGSLEADTDSEQADKTYKKPTVEKIPQNRPRSPFFYKLIFTWIFGERLLTCFALTSWIRIHTLRRCGRAYCITRWLPVSCSDRVPPPLQGSHTTENQYFGTLICSEKHWKSCFWVLNIRCPGMGGYWYSVPPLFTASVDQKSKKCHPTDFLFLVMY
ncbi:hypothetical protein K438DRAFT_1782958 [Mycena galopus ATCC 62051]|nr:hypothetical protein K438DRAFT_1782958 [Mycena galopus ATCC 62051]